MSGIVHPRGMQPPWLRREPLGVEARFWPKVLKSECCWEWQAAKRPTGYGMLLVEGRPRAAHRLSWEMHQGRIPDGMCVLHRCDNPCCVRPDHLFLGTQQDNVADMMTKQRVQHGERSGLAKLTDEKVKEMRALHLAGMGTRALSRRFGLSNATASNVLRRITWRHVA